MTIDKTKIRNAATVIVLRDRHVTPHILMGQRGAKAAFMPNKFVFPGGAVDATDAQVPLAAPVNALCHGRLCDDAEPSLAHAIAVAAIRELWEETGLVLGRKGAWEGDVPADWKTFAATGHLPDASALQFVFRALRGSFWSTPKTSPAIRMISMPPVMSFRICNGCRSAGRGRLTCPSSPRSCWPKSPPAHAIPIRPPRSRFSKTTTKRACSCVCMAAR